MLRTRTGYSFRHSVGHLRDVIARLQKCNYSAAPITDRASTFGWVKWNHLCEDKKIRPVFGIELAVTDSINAKRPTVDHWVFLAQNDIGDINRLTEIATRQFRYQPLLTYEQASHAPGVFKIMGYKSQLDHVEHGTDLFAGLSPACSRGYVTAIKNKKIPFLAVGENVFTIPEQNGFYEVVAGRNSSMQSYPQHILTQDEWEEAVSYVGFSKTQLNDIWKNSRQILKNCTAKLKHGKLLAPERPVPLLKMCEKGAEKLGVNLKDSIYRKRLHHELTLIEEKEYEDYFYIVSDICEFARSRMIVGPARGSSCGSLVCYLLGITTVDPIPHGLIFERFIDINRNDLPDIDIDFSDQHRHMVFKYMSDKYGENRVARLGTVAMYKSRSALSESGAALSAPRWMCDAVAESLIERSSGDSRALLTLEDTLKTMPAGKELLEKYPAMIVAASMEGHPRHYSQHAAAVVIAEKPITDFVAVDHRSGATMCDKYDAEAINLLKIDALGLTQLSVFEDALDMAGLARDTLENLSLDDQDSFEVLNKGHFAGIFQFNGMALQSICKQFEVTDFNDIVQVTALGRPGPLASGGAHEWIRRKNGINSVTYPHPVFEPYLNDTLGIVLYQEQVMEIGRNIGGLDWGQVTALRKAMSRSLGTEYFDQFGDPWKKGAIAKGVNPNDANKVWDDLCAYGAWSFNKSHSVAYGLISYWCCWLKAHHPFEFAAATLSHEKDPDRQIQLLREIVSEGYSYEPFSPELSGEAWTVDYREVDGELLEQPVLIGPLTNIKGIGPKTLAAILDARKNNVPLPEKIQKMLSKDIVTPIDTLYPIGDAFKRLIPDPSARNIITPPTPIIDIKIMEKDYEVMVFCTTSKINPRDENEVINVQRRGYEIKDGPTASLNLQLTDDTDTVFGKIDRFKYLKMGKPIVDRGRPGKSLYAVKGVVRGGGTFRMILIKQLRYIGDVDGGSNSIG